jgi:hypothetical protein
VGCAVIHWQNVLKVANETPAKNRDPAEGRVVLRVSIEFKLSFPISLFGKFRVSVTHQLIARRVGSEFFGKEVLAK